MADWGYKWGEPLTAGELLEIGREALEPLFHEPPIGPIPDYLTPYLSVHGCVAEYEEKLEELERWKARKLSSWLKDKTGMKWSAGVKIYELRMEKAESTVQEKFWFKVVEDRS